MLKLLLKQLNIEEDRVILDWVSASEGEKFAKVVDKMNARITELGPLNWDKVVSRT